MRAKCCCFWFFFLPGAVFDAVAKRDTDTFSRTALAPKQMVGQVTEPAIPTMPPMPALPAPGTPAILAMSPPGTPCASRQSLFCQLYVGIWKTV